MRRRQFRPCATKILPGHWQLRWQNDGTRSARRMSNSACGGAFSIRIGVQKIPWSKVRSERLDALTGGASGAVSRGQWPPATARLSAACLKRCLNADASAKVRKQYRTQFEGRSTHMSHSNDEPSSQSRTSMAASSKDNGTWNGKSRLISRIALTAYREHKRNKCSMGRPVEVPACRTY